VKIVSYLKVYAERLGPIYVTFGSEECARRVMSRFLARTEIEQMSDVVYAMRAHRCVATVTIRRRVHGGFNSGIRRKIARDAFNSRPRVVAPQISTEDLARTMSPEFCDKHAEGKHCFPCSAALLLRAAGKRVPVQIGWSEERERKVSLGELW